MSKRQNQATVGLNKFRDAQFADRVYELNRIMMAVASTDGSFVPELDGESWAGRNNIAAPYTPEEQDMLKKAYQAVGSHHEDINHGEDGTVINLLMTLTALYDKCRLVW